MSGILPVIPVISPAPPVNGRRISIGSHSPPHVRLVYAIFKDHSSTSQRPGSHRSSVTMYGEKKVTYVQAQKWVGAQKVSGGAVCRSSVLGHPGHDIW
jgi:hypothetical protein